MVSREPIPANSAPLSALLAASVGWNVWYYRLEQKRRVQAQAEERALKAAEALANEKAEQARLKRQLRDAKPPTGFSNSTKKSTSCLALASSPSRLATLKPQ